MEEGTSHVPSNQVPDEKGFADQPDDRAVGGAKDVDMGVDSGESACNPASGEPSRSNPASLTNKPKSKSAIVKLTELGEGEMLKAYLEAFFDHFIYFKKSGGELHGNIGLDTIIRVEELERGGLLHLDPPIRRASNPCPPPRWVPEFEYDENLELRVGSGKLGR